MLQNILNVAVWIAIAANLTIASFMTVQAFLDRGRRWQFAAFALSWWAQTGFASFQSFMPRPEYEICRVACSALFAGSLIWLLGNSWKSAVITGLGIGVVGFLVWRFWRYDLATTFTFTLAFALAAFAHARQYKKSRGFASCILCAYSLALAILCSAYFAVMATKDPIIILLGYAQFVLLNCGAVLLGWVHLPRELQGRTSVAIIPTHAYSFICGIVFSELLVVAGQLWLFRWPPSLYIAGSMLLVILTLILYFYHRHQLVIFTDNVATLLEDWTSALRKSREILEQQNGMQAELLQRQTLEIQAKAQVIERQRRLELAAQTAGQASHDIHNLLSPFGTYLQTLEKEATDPQKVGAIAVRMRRRLDQLLDLNTQLNTLSRRGRMEFHPVDIKELVEELVAGYRGQQISVVSQNEAWVLGAWSQLFRAVSNIVQNALESRADSPVEIRIGRIVVQETRHCSRGPLQPGDYVRIEVRDQGAGIPENLQDRIFEPFFSTKERRTRSGSGLGLSIVSAVVNDHGGTIDLDSGPGGTTIALYFPAIDPAERATPPNVSGNETVMVIEDDEKSRMRCEESLEAAGYSVISVSSAREALKVFQIEKVDLLVVDQQVLLSSPELIPGALHFHAGIKIITGRHGAGKRTASPLLNAGISAVLEKPWNAPELLRTIRRMLDPRKTPPLSPSGC